MPSTSTDQSGAHAALEQLATELRHAVLDVVWRQWRVLGAGAAAPFTMRSTSHGEEGRRQLRTLVDPEALVLVSLMLSDDERRLVDLLHDWGARNSDLLSVQRMRNLEAGYPETVRSILGQRLAWFAAVARDEGKDLRWRPLAKGWTGVARMSPTAEGDQSGSEILDTDGIRSRSTPGSRGNAGASKKSRATRARLTSDVTLLLRLRLGLGVGVKSDLLAFLLARDEEWATVRDIADATRYTVTAVRRAAEDLAAARLVESLGGQPTTYRAVYAAWAPLLSLEDRPPRWGSWHERFVFATDFLRWADVAREHPLSDYAFGVHGRQLLEKHRTAFEHDLVAVWSEHSQLPDWGAFLSRSVRDLGAWMEEMG